MSDILDNIDWRLLRTQRLAIIGIIDDFVQWQEDGSRQDQIDALEGVLNLLDAIQDKGDEEGLVPPDAWLSEDN
jgi:hypothetical protein